MKNVFLIYRPFHLDYAQVIIEKHFQEGSNLIVNHFKNEGKDEILGDTAEIINVPESFILRIRVFRDIKRVILSLAQKNEDINIFIPHTLGVLSNYSYFRLSNKYANIKINIFYEGVIFFKAYRHPILQNVMYYLTRKLAGFLIGINYNISPRLLDLQDKRISKIYSPFLEIDAPIEKIVETPLKKLTYIPKSDVCIILGHRIDFDQSEQIRIVTEMFKKIDKLGVKNIFLKNHPAERNDVFAKVAENLGKEILIIKDPIAIEKIICNYRPAFIFSCWSSGILNLRKMLAPEIQIYSYVSSKIISTSDLKKNIIAFKKVNIEVVYV